MSRSGSIGSDVNEALWTIGWNWLAVFVGGPILGIILGFVVEGALGWVLGLLTFFGAPMLAVAGLVYVRMNVSGVARSGISEVKDEAITVARLDGDHETFSLLTKHGDSRFLLPRPKRSVATLIVGDSLLLVHDDANVDLPGLSWSVGDSTNEFYFDQIAGVNYNPDEKSEGGTFWVNLSDGHGQSWDTVEDASDALHTVQDRIRSYKTRGTRQPAQ